MSDAAVLAADRSPYYVDGEGELRFRYHAGQRQMIESRKRFILVLAGTQSGKTVSGPWWLLKEICRCGPGDYLVAAPTFQLMKKKVLPEFKKLFRGRLSLGDYHTQDKIFTFSEEGQKTIFGEAGSGKETQIFFGHAQDPESLESATYRAAWLDEAGQKKFKRGSWEAIQRRLSIYLGRVLTTTTPYALGWLKSELHDPVIQAREWGHEHENIALINFESTMNPAFPQEEFERMKQKLPPWKFNMMYRGRFERPAGMIYDVFDDSAHVIPEFLPGKHWARYLGLDFGGVNTVGIKAAREPHTNRYVVYDTYHEGGRTAAEHKRHMLAGEPQQPTAVGGAPSEGQWRQEFGEAGLPVKEPPVSDVEVGIDRVYGMLKNHPALDGQEIEVGEDGDTEVIIHDPSRPWLEITENCGVLIDELGSYSRELDEDDKPTEKIEDKSSYHHADGLRYLAALLLRGKPASGTAMHSMRGEGGGPTDTSDPLVSMR